MNRQTLKKLGAKFGVILDPDIKASEVSLMSRYNTPHRLTFEKIVEREVDKLNESINSTMKFSSDKVLPKIFTPDQKPLYQAVKRKFEERGFKVFFGNSENIPELNDTEFIFISWDIRDDEEAKYMKENPRG